MTRNIWQSFIRAQQGNVLMLTGLGMLFLVGIGGAGYDLGRQQLVRQKIQQASDAASLAAAGMDFGTSDATRQNTAQAFFALNYPNDYLGVARPTPSISIAGETITVRANSSVPTSFVGNFGVSSIAAAGSSTTRFKRLQTVLDVILVLDNSGSMAIADVGTGNSLNASAGVRPICRAGWIAYAAALGITINNAQANQQCNQTEGATGFNRLNALRFSANALVDRLMNPNPNNNRVALLTWDAFLIRTQGFTSNASTARNFLGTMYGRASTNSTAGLQQAQSLSSQFRPNVARAVILMTDGFNNLGNLNPDGTEKSPAQIAADQIAVNNASLALCNQLKAQSTLIYTIGFGSELEGDNPFITRASQFLSDCATGPNGTSQPNLDQFYFRAPDAAALARAFNQIAGSLQRVQILQ
jgi:hypothetical protein